MSWDVDDVLRQQLRDVARSARPVLPWEDTVQGATVSLPGGRVTLLAQGSRDDYVGVAFQRSDAGPYAAVDYWVELRRGYGVTHCHGPVRFDDRGLAPSEIVAAATREATALAEAATLGRCGDGLEERRGQGYWSVFVENRGSPGGRRVSAREHLHVEPLPCPILNPSPKHYQFARYGKLLGGGGARLRQWLEWCSRLLQSRQVSSYQTGRAMSQAMLQYGGGS